MAEHPLATRFIADIELLAVKENCMLWAVNSAFTQEIFVSSTFKTLWKLETTDMYRNKNAKQLGDYVNSFTNVETFHEMQKRAINLKHTVVYEIKLPNNQLQLVEDRSFHLNDTDGECLLIAGVAIFVTENDFSKRQQQIISDRIDKISLEYYRLLSKPCVIPPSTSSITVAKLSAQQKIVLKYILHGLNAKEIAKKMHLSFRTVEFHTNKIKDIFDVSSKSELISVALRENLMSVFI